LFIVDFYSFHSIVAGYINMESCQVYYVQGGVARNVAECMSKLGAKPYMISALGFDMAGKILIFISKHLKFYLLAFVMIKTRDFRGATSWHFQLA
jgi:receptor expression-enhancing protein 5/6